MLWQWIIEWTGLYRSLDYWDLEESYRVEVHRAYAVAGKHWASKTRVSEPKRPTLSTSSKVEIPMDPLVREVTRVGLRWKVNGRIKT